MSALITLMSGKSAFHQILRWQYPLPSSSPTKSLAMASAALSILPPNLKPISLHHPLTSSSLLKPTTIIISPPTTRTRNPTTLTTITCSHSPKIVRCPSLDRHASAHSRLRFVRKLTTLLLSKPRHFLPLRLLRRCRPYLSLSPDKNLLSMILRYPSIFRLLYPSPASALLSVSLTPAAESLFSRLSLLRSSLSSALADKLLRLLMLSSHPRLLLSDLVHIAPDLGLPPNFRSRLCNSHPDLFHTVDTSYGRALELVSRPDHLAVPMPPICPPQTLRNRPIIDRPPKFKQVRLRRGLNVKRRHLDYLIRFQELPEVNPYLRRAEEGMLAEEKEKRACAVVREVLGLTVEKRTLVDHLTHFRKAFGLPNRLRAMLVRHPEMFYVSVKGQRDSVFLVEAYDDKGRLVVEDELLAAKDRLEELVREGKRMRRDRRRGVAPIGDDDRDETEDEEEEGEFYEDDDDGLGDLFESGIGDDWEEFGSGEGGVGDEEGREIVEFWSLKAAGETIGSEGGEERLETW